MPLSDMHLLVVIKRLMSSCRLTFYLKSSIFVYERKIPLCRANCQRPALSSPRSSTLSQSHRAWLWTFRFLFLLHRDNRYITFFQARKALAAYHGITDSTQLDDQLKQCTESGKTTTSTKPNNSDVSTTVPNNVCIPKHVTGIDVMFNPCKANDPVSKVVRQAAWLGVMVKVSEETFHI